jgi:hypothetical protein
MSILFPSGRAIAKSRRSANRVLSQPRIYRLAFKSEDSEDALVNTAQWFNQSQHLQYTHHGNNVPGSEVERLVFEGVKAEGGINPKIVVSTGKPGYFAIAHSHGQKIRAGTIRRPPERCNPS